MSTPGDRRPTTLGVVSFLNSRPLIDGLEARPEISLRFAVPAALPSLLRTAQVDAALIPVIDVARSAGAWEPISDACIGSEGETLTVRVFSRVPPERMRTLHVDPDSHTSVALATLIWKHNYGRRLELRPLSEAPDVHACESVLLIGDKVVTTPLHEHRYDIDLGGAWRAWTGLPFVFAVWAAPCGTRSPGSCGTGFQPVAEKCGTGVPPVWCGTGVSPVHSSRENLAQTLSAARDRGVARARAIAAEFGPARGWPIELAEEYLTRRLSFTLTPRHREGMRRFIELAMREETLAETSK